MSKQIFVVESLVERMDAFITEEALVTRSYVKQLNDKGNILVNGEVVKAGKNLKIGDVVEVDFPEEITSVEPQNIPLNILYEDNDVVVINKQQGLIVHPSSGNYSGTLVNALLYHIKDLSTINGVVRPGIVHRLDKNTSGVMVVAKNDNAHLNLSKQIAAREVVKIYRAVLEGNLTDDSGEISTNIGRDSKDRKKMAVTNDGKLAVTKYKVLERYKSNCYAEFNLLTGRTHQIRVHAKYLSHPVVGDDVYGFTKQRFILSGQLLHSYSLTFSHPTSGEKMTFIAPLPSYFENVLEILRQES